MGLAGYLDKLVLGSAQFGQLYGITNYYGRPTRKEAFAILARAWELGIRQFDTAPGYNSESLLGDFVGTHGIHKEVKVHTKVPAIKNDIRYTDRVRSSIHSSLEKLQCSIGTLFLHDNTASRIVEKHVHFFKSIISNGLVEDLGISIYEPHEIKQSSNHEIDLAYQYPFNVIDQRFLNVHMHVGKRYARSIFMQGLLASSIRPCSRAPSALRELQYRYHSIVSNNGWCPINFALSFVNNSKNVDHILVGVDHIDQLNHICSLDLYDDETTSSMNLECLVRDVRLLDPRQWSK